MADVHDMVANHDPNIPDTSSAQVLTNTDLLHHIFMLIPSSPDSGRDSYLARCAIVCRTFHEPAIRVLWRNLNSLLLVWHLLAPLDIPYPFSSGGDGDALSYLLKINAARLYLDPTRWNRFQEHVTHVRRIAYDTGSPQGKRNRDANNLLFQSVIAQNGGNTILSLLRTIEWRGRAPDDDTLIPLFTSTLRSITIHLTGTDEEAHIPLFRRIHESSPLLEKITLFTSDFVAGPSMIVKELVRCFSRLQHIQVSRISGPDVFHALATMPHLTSLSVLEVIGLWAGPGHAISARYLQELHVMGKAPALSGLFDRVRFPALRSAIIQFTFYGGAQVTPQDITAFLSLFSNAVSADSLHSLQLSPQLAQPSGRKLPTFRDLLAPILPLHALRAFNLSTADTIATLDDADVDALARAWPNMERLHIAWGSSPQSSLSFNALYCLHRHWVHIQELSIPRLRWPIIGVHLLPAPLDTSDDGSLAQGAAGKSRALRRLTVRDAYLPRTMTAVSFGPELSDESAEAMARYLLDLFPRLEPEQYKEAAQREDESSSSARRKKRLESIMGFDGRWRKVSGCVYALCCARDGLEV